MPRLYMTGAFFFILMYTGSNVIPIGRYIVRLCVLKCNEKSWTMIFLLLILYLHHAKLLLDFFKKHTWNKPLDQKRYIYCYLNYSFWISIVFWLLFLPYTEHTKRNAAKEYFGTNTTRSNDLVPWKLW